MDYFIYRITEKPFRQLEKIEQQRVSGGLPYEH